MGLDHGMKPGRPSVRDLVLFSLPCLGLAGIGLPLQVYLPPYYSADLGLNLSAVGVAFMIVRLLDIGIDPALGILMDRTRLPFGRFKTWLSAGVPLLMLASVVLFFAKPGVTTSQLAIGLALAYGGWSVCVVAQTSWGALLSPSYNERSRVYGWWQFFNMLGLLMVLILPIGIGYVTPGDAPGIRAMGLWLFILTPVSTALALAFVKEPPPADGARLARIVDVLELLGMSAVRRLLACDFLISLSFGMTGALFVFFFTKAKGFDSSFTKMGLLAYFLGGVIGGPFWTILSNRVNKHSALIWSCLGATVGLVLLYLTPNGHKGLAFLAIMLGGLPYAAPNQISRAMLADAADQDRLESGVDRVGLLYALVAATAKIGPALAVGITFVGLDQLVGFDPNSDHNSPLAIHGLEAFFILLPAVLFALATLCLIGYPLTRRRHDEIRRALEANPQS
jgi:GPH family glycoside/pentoside/hexuronide:cation symporter